MHNYIIPLGGLLTGTGLMTMLFGWQSGTSGDMAEQISTVGFSGVGDLSMTSSGPIAFVLILVGIALMVYGNSTAWKVTGGY